MRKLAALIGIAGVGIWALGIIAWISGVWVTMPPDQVKVLVLTAAALSGAALVVTAAVIGRAATTIENRRFRDSRVQNEITAYPFDGGEATTSHSDKERDRIAR